MPYYPQPNYYNPYLYSPAPTPVQPIQPVQTPAPAQQSAPAPSPAPQPATGIIWIGSEKDAAMYPVAPNNAVTLWNQNEPVVYLKQADATGKPTLKTYDLVERPETARDTRNTSNEKLPDYATKNELAAVVAAVRDIDGLISSLTREVDELKASRKPKKKAEEDNE